jgi:hypothetical protein
LARRARLDEPDSWHHVYNRGASKRPVFLCRADFRYFLACLARVVRLGLIELHAHVLLRTHYHLLVRSLVGRLDEALKLAQNRYSRYFNRRMRRDGGLWHSRYKSKRVLSNAYHRYLVSYIDANALKAAKAASPVNYPWGSASLYARSKRPQWLATAWVESEVRLLTGSSAEDRDAYHRRFPVRCSPDFLAWVERRLNARDDAVDDLDDLVENEPGRVRDWLMRKTLLADGRPDWLPVVSPEATHAAARLERTRTGGFRFAPNGRARPGWAVLEAGLLRDACRLSYPEIATRTGCSVATAHSRVRAHRAAFAGEPGYAERASEVLRLAVQAMSS